MSNSQISTRSKIRM